MITFRKASLPVVAAFAALFSILASAENPDLIFSDGAEAGFIVRGKAFAAEPLANAEIEARFDGRVIRTNTDGQGNYELAVWVLRDLSATAVLTARGTGKQAAQVWQTVLGPINETQPSAGADGVLERSEDPFVDLTPRTTAISATLREGGAGSIPANAASYHRAARGIQHIYISSLSVMLHLYAQGIEAFPAGVSNTLAAVGSIDAMQRVYARRQELSQSAGNCQPPTAPFCVATALYNTDENLVPAVLPTNETTYLGSLLPFGRSSGFSGGVIFNGATADLWHVDGTSSSAVPVAAGPLQWPIRVGFPDQRALLTSVSFPFNATVGSQVRQLIETYALHYRFVLGPAGQPLASVGSSVRLRYPDHPQLTDVDQPVNALGSAPQLFSDFQIPATLAGNRPAIAGQRILVPVATAPNSGQAWALQYDIGQFDPQGTIQFERSTVSGSWAMSADGGLLINLAQQLPVEMRIDFFNEEEPGVWRVLTRARRAGQSQNEVFGTGLLTTALPRQPGFAAFDFADRRIRSEINAQQCGGPLGAIQNQVPSSLSPLCFPPFGWQFNADGTAFNVPFPPPSPNRFWSIMTGGNLGLIFIEGRTSNGLISQQRAWQKVKSIGNRSLVLEDFVFFTTPSATPPPLIIGRTIRLNELSPFPD